MIKKHLTKTNNPFNHSIKLVILALLLGVATTSRAADYVLAYVNGSTTYYLARNGTSGVQRVTTFDPTTCIWSCASNTAGTTASELPSSSSYGYLYQTVNGTSYFLNASSATLGLGTDASSSNYYRWRTTGTYVYNRYNNNNSYYINLQNGVARATSSSTTCARPYQVTTANVAEAITGSLSTPTITPAATQTLEYGGSASYTASANGPTRIVPAHTTYTFNSTTHYYYNNQVYTSTNGFTFNNPEVTYSWTLSGDGASALQLETSTGGATTVNYTGSAGGTTATLTVTATAATLSQSASVTINITAVEPTAIAAEDNTVYVSNSGTVSYSLTPSYAYDRVNATSSNTGIVRVDASPVTGGIVSLTGVSAGQATLTLTALNSDGSKGSDAKGPSTTVTVTVRDICATPQITFSESSGTVTATLTCATSGATIHYTTDGTDPTPSSATYTSPITVTEGQTIKAIAVKDGYWDNSVVASQTALPIYYVVSGVSGGTVTLNDLEDHNWTYYSGVDATMDGGNYNTNYLGKLYNPNPRNVKITYQANGGAVSINESETEFVYYKTLEESATSGEYAYQVISNPFSKRPNGKGFGGWKITSGADYIKGHSANDVLALDEEIVFNNLSYASTNCTSAEIVFEATWVTLNNITYASGNTFTYNVSGGTYETNFLVLNRNVTGTITTTSPVTIMMVEPDGSSDYRGTYAFTGNITPNNNGVTKIEFARWNSTNTVNANYNDLWIGRGMTTTSRCANLITGVNSTGSVASPQYSIKVESGVYQYFDFYKGHSTYTGGYDNTGFTVSGSSANARITIGNDYDRASGTNTNLEFIYGPMLGYSGSFSSTGNRDNLHTLDLVIKSGSIGTTFFMENTNTATYLQGGAGYCMYLSSAGSQTNVGTRNVTIEGGDVCSIGGGIDSYNNNVSDVTNYNRLGLNLRIKGGTIHGNVYGGAAKSPSGGNRVMVMTGGTVKGWFAAGCNGTDDDGGQNYGTSYVYIGGKGAVDSDGSTKVLGYANGGNVYAAGAGRQGATTCGEMTFGSNLVIADDSYIERGIYGGGNYGYALENTKIYITGGINEGLAGTVNSVTTEGGLYGGANQQDGPDVQIYMNGGEMRGGVYGGCNTQGTISSNVTMQINGGQVGTSSAPANIHGGGYGQNTVVSGNVDLTLGATGQTEPGVTVFGDVYGGSALGNVNGTSATGTYHTNVTLNAGTIFGSLYGGALGSSSIAANVNGPVTVTVNGGSVKKTDANGANGSGAVYGCNNINGAPQRAVSVVINGTDPAPSSDEYALYAVYGGGNQANYSYGTPSVTVHNCDNSIEYVYGGGNAAHITNGNTNVLIYGGNSIGNVFGGGNGTVTPANVSGNTNVTIHGGTIGRVFGGSNSQGTIGGAINVLIEKDAGNPCALNIGEVYSGGNQAPSNVGSLTIGCMDDGDIIDYVYGGSNDADITGDIKLNIYGGRINNVFGGNNTGHTVSGTIQVNVDWTQGTCTSNYLGNVYGGGNLAEYDHGGNYPEVNIINATVSGNVFGGGNGDPESATQTPGSITGNPQVKIGTASSQSVTVRGNVFGGGNAAKIEGNPYVFIGHRAKVFGNIYGGGNMGRIEGNTKVIVNGE